MPQVLGVDSTPIRIASRMNMSDVKLGTGVLAGMK